MHSRVFQLSETPVQYDELLKEYDIIDNTSFLGPIADYVVEIDRSDDEESLNWLSACMPGLDVDVSGRKLTIRNKKEYFAAKFQNFKDLCRKAADLSLETFCGDKAPESMADSASWIMYGLNSNFEDKYGFYVYDDGMFMPMDEFVRHNKEGSSFYVGTIFDYHM